MANCLVHIKGDRELEKYFKGAKESEMLGLAVKYYEKLHGELEALKVSINPSYTPKEFDKNLVIQSENVAPAPSEHKTTSDNQKPTEVTSDKKSIEKVKVKDLEVGDEVVLKGKEGTWKVAKKTKDGVDLSHTTKQGSMFKGADDGDIEGKVVNRSENAVVVVKNKSYADFQKSIDEATNIEDDVTKKLENHYRSKGVSEDVISQLIVYGNNLNDFKDIMPEAMSAYDPSIKELHDKMESATKIRVGIEGEFVSRVIDDIGKSFESVGVTPIIIEKVKKFFEEYFKYGRSFDQFGKKLNANKFNDLKQELVFETYSQIAPEQFRGVDKYEDIPENIRQKVEDTVDAAMSNFKQNILDQSTSDNQQPTTDTKSLGKDFTQSESASVNLSDAGSGGVGGDVEATAKALEDLSKNKTERFYPDDKVILTTKDGKEVEVSFRGYNGEKKAVIFGSRGSGINQMEVDVSQLRAKNKSDKLTKDERNNLLSKIDFQDKEAPTYKDDFTDKELQDLSVRYPKRDKLSNKEKNDLNDFQIATTPLKRWQEQEYGVDDPLDPTNIRLAKEHETAINNIINNDKFSTLLAEAYHKAKVDGSNPELVKAVEQSIKETTKAETPTTTKESNVVEGSGGVGKPSIEKTELYNVPILLDPKAKVRGDKQEYITREVFDRAFEKDDREGINFQTADTLIRRGGYSTEELNKLLPNWRELLPKKQSLKETTKAGSVGVGGDVKDKIENFDYSINNIIPDENAVGWVDKNGNKFNVREVLKGIDKDTYNAIAKKVKEALKDTHYYESDFEAAIANVYQQIKEQSLKATPQAETTSDKKSGGEPTSDNVIQSEKPNSYKGIFNPKKTGIIGLDELLKDDGGYHYFYKGVSAEVVMMSPDEYLKKVRTDITRTDRDEGIYDEKKEKINEAIDKGAKIDMPYLSLKENGKAHKQEGRNRATIAKERGEKLIPVFIEKDVSFDDKIAKGSEYIKSAIKNGATTKEEVLSKLKEQGLHHDAIRFIDNNFDEKAIENLTSDNNINPSKPQPDAFDKAADATIAALKKNKIVGNADMRKGDTMMGGNGEKIIRAAFDASRVIYHTTKSLAEAIKKALKTVRDSDWYKNLSGDQKSEIDSLVRKQLNDYAKENVVAEPLDELDLDMQDQSVKDQIMIEAQNLITTEEFKDAKEFSLRLKELYGIKETDAKAIYDKLVDFINVQTEDPFKIALRGKGAVTAHMNNTTINESSEDEIGNRTYLANSFDEMNEDIDAVFGRIKAANPNNWEKIIADKILKKLDERDMQAAIFADRFVTYLNTYLADHQRSPNYTAKALEYKGYRREILARRQKFTQEYATYFAKLRELKINNPLTLIKESGMLTAAERKAAKEMDEKLKGKKEYDASGKKKPFVEDSALDKAAPTSDKKGKSTSDKKDKPPTEKQAKKAKRAEVKKDLLKNLAGYKNNAADLAIKVKKTPC